ncbi:unnamed protein product [Lasius platythorax]|uniref:Uncharacterized protein n=1 Tax=Lasius platythorax TaxID=488582 RepID=A0AAV2MZP5_9HYME
MIQVIPRIFTGQDSNMSSSDQNLKRSVEHDTSPAKQRQYLKNNKATLEMEEMCSEDTGSNDTDGIPEMEDLDASNESE